MPIDLATFRAEADVTPSWWASQPRGERGGYRREGAVITAMNFVGVAEVTSGQTSLKAVLVVNTGYTAHTIDEYLGVLRTQIENLPEWSFGAVDIEIGAWGSSGKYVQPVRPEPRPLPVAPPNERL